MKPLPTATKWGDRDSTKVKWTSAFKELVYSQLGIDQGTPKKTYLSKSPETIHEQPPDLPKEFLDNIGLFLHSTQISSDFWERIENSLGQGYLELIQTRIAKLPPIAELVIYPHSHDEIVSVIQAAKAFGIPLCVRGGGTSVTHGVSQISKGCTVLNITRMARILAINQTSMYVTAQTGVLGPFLEDNLNSNGLTLGHFPQSFEYSCLGGWIATRGAGQNSTLYGKIEDMLMGLKVATGKGTTLEIKTVPARSTGPDFTHIFSGSEGVFGIITEATLRVWPIPQARKFSAFFFRSFEDGINAYRELIQAGFRPAILRLSDASETYFNLRASSLMHDPPREPSYFQQIGMKYLTSRGFSEGKRCLGIMVIEGQSNLVSMTRKHAISLAKKHHGYHLGASPGEQWYNSRFDTPFLRDSIIDHGVLLETFETAVTWEKLLPLYHAVLEVLSSECPMIWTHGSHFYVNGANLYFTVLAPQEEGNEIDQFHRIRKKVLDTFLANGGTLSHHHGIGRSFSAWLQEEIGSAGMGLLKDLKQSLDPEGILNPGIFGLNRNQKVHGLQTSDSL
ncbi:MAG: FAD-binding oxidoreductase [Candidatus Thorarchaeota archaeon]